MQRFSFSKDSEKTRFMGVINITNDSFYEKSRCLTIDSVMTLAEKMINDGADFLDLGAESSRPGSMPISEQEELGKLIPIIDYLAKRIDVPISVDTYKPIIAEEALLVGAQIINDITGMQTYPEMAKVVSRHKAGIVAMHMQGDPSTMQDKPIYSNVVEEVKEFLANSIRISEKANINSDQIAIDPGIGFGKNQTHNLELIKNLHKFSQLKKPVLIGVSRKSFIGNILGFPAKDRLEGSLGASVVGVLKGAKIIRTHDIKETRNAVKVAEEIMGEDTL